MLMHSDQNYELTLFVVQQPTYVVPPLLPCMAAILSELSLNVESTIDNNLHIK